MKHQLRLFAADIGEPFLPYTSYSINEREYLGTFNGCLKECERWLQSNGYHYQLFAATKKFDDNYDDGSYARLPSKHPDEVVGTKLAKLDPKECQYHVHPFDKGEYVELYGHYEIHPYPHIPHWDIKRPYPRHYRPTWDREDNNREKWTYLRGIVDERLQSKLQ